MVDWAFICLHTGTVSVVQFVPNMSAPHLRTLSPLHHHLLLVLDLHGGQWSHQNQLFCSCT